MKSLRLQAFGDLLKRYAAVFKAAWAVRADMESPKRLPHEMAFLPAHLELVETPIHPLPLWTVRGIALLVLLVIAVSLIGKLDIIVVARGKLIPSNQVKIIQPAMAGVVQNIFVRSGQKVKAGDVLIQLDTNQARTDFEKAKASRIDAALTVARVKALLKAQETNKPPIIEKIEGASLKRQEEAQNFANGWWYEYQDKMVSAQAELEKNEAQRRRVLQEIAKLEETAPLARKRANDYRVLAAKNYATKHEYVEREQAALELEYGLKSQRNYLEELTATVEATKANIVTLASQFKREQLDVSEKATLQLAQSQEDEIKTQIQQELLTITSPVNGTVQQMVIHTLGGVVNSGQALMEVVPEQAVIVEAAIENKDVGFVSVGDDVTVKIDAFPYTLYGKIPGKVISVANNATQPKEQAAPAPLTFATRIELSSGQIKVNDKWINLTPGMEISAEIRTGKRRVIHYFLGPLVKGVKESMNER